MKKTKKPWIKINLKNVLKDSANEIIAGLKDVSLMLINKRSKK
tara:strand:- start:967 stop:1095 length:129 start_codon:yes stop_codon:yes gene_type:complete